MRPPMRRPNDRSIGMPMGNAFNMSVQGAFCDDISFHAAAQGDPGQADVQAAAGAHPKRGGDARRVGTGRCETFERNPQHAPLAR